MDRTERFYKIDRLLQGQGCVPLTRFLEELGVSRATFKRDLEYLRDRLHAPIEWDRERRGYRYAAAVAEAAPPYQLPGLWFNASEIRALLTMQHLLADLQPGVLEPQIAPLRARLRALLDAGEHSVDEIERRVRVLHAGARVAPLPHFEQVAAAVLERRRLRITYSGRERGERSTREISPQRLVHYRGNWYLDAWCHWREALRSFAIDAIEAAQLLDRKAKNVAEHTLDEALGSGYGIFSGRARHWARLRFTPRRARWVSVEQWHPQQKASWQADGSWVLEVPYSDDRELLGDILRHGAEVEVLAPPALRRALCAQLAAMLQRHAD